MPSISNPPSPTNTSRLFVNIVMTGNCFKAFIDSGSDVSLVTSQFLPYVSNFIVANTSLTAVEGSTITVLGTGDLSFDLYGKPITTRVYVVERILHPIMLGLDFLRKQVISIDFVNNCLVLKCQDQEHYCQDVQGVVTGIDQADLTITDFPRSQLCDIVVDREISLSPGSKIVISSVAENITVWHKVDSFHPSTYLLSQPNLQVLSYDCHAKDEIQCCIQNASEIPVSISKDMNLGTMLVSPTIYESTQIKGYPGNWLDSVQDSVHYRILAMLIKYRDTINSGKIKFELPPVTIDTGNARPVYCRPYRLSEQKAEFVKQQFQKWLDEGIVSYYSGPWCSPVVVANKDTRTDNPTFRVCGDYTKINLVIERESFPLPIPSDLFVKMRGSECFSIIDLHQAYLQLKVAEQDKPKTSVVTPEAQFVFNYLPFGLKIAASCMQKVMHMLFSNCNFVVCYQDDICIFSKNMQEHFQHVETVLTILADAGLKIALHKCKFVQSSIKYLGMLIDGATMSPDPRNVKAILDWNVPTNPKQIRQLLGAVSYYRAFVPHFADRTTSLRALLKSKVKWVWNPDHDSEFEDVKSMLTSSPILRVFDPELPTVLKTDASSHAVGAVLCQLVNGKEQVVSYYSQALTMQQKKWSALEREAFAVVAAVTHYRHFLECIRFAIISDAHSLCYMRTIRDPTSRIARWLLLMQEFDYRVHYRSGSCQKDVDCLSRYGYESDDLAVGMVSLQDVKDEQLRELQDGSLPTQKLVETRESGLYYYHRMQGNDNYTPLLYLPKSMRSQVLHLAHGDSMSGHYGINKTWTKLANVYFWPGMYSDIRKFVRSCHDCQLRNIPTVKPAGLLQSIPVSNIFDTVGIDFIGPISRTPTGNLHILLAVDHFSKFVVAKATRVADSTTVANFLLKHIVLQYGLPSRILSDRGTPFLSQTVTQILQLLNIKKANTSAYHPQCDGEAEISNKTIINLLSKMVQDNLTHWDEYLDYVVYQYNTTFQDSIKTSPYSVLYGMVPRSLPYDIEHEPLVPKRSPYDHAASGFAYARDVVRENIVESQRRQAHYYDKKHTQVRYQIGELVMLKDVRIAPKGTKLHPKFSGPHKIVGVVNPVNFSVLLRSTDKIIHVHVSRLKRFYQRSEDERSQDEDDDEGRQPNITEEPLDAVVPPSSGCSSPGMNTAKEDLSDSDCLNYRHGVETLMDHMAGMDLPDTDSDLDSYQSPGPSDVDNDGENDSDSMPELESSRKSSSSSEPSSPRPEHQPYNLRERKPVQYKY